MSSSSDADEDVPTPTSSPPDPEVNNMSPDADDAQRGRGVDNLNSLADFRSHTSRWTLATDNKLINQLFTLSESFQTKASATSNALLDLEAETNRINCSLKNTVNELLMLSDGQFVENRVYDEVRMERRRGDLCIGSCHYLSLFEFNSSSQERAPFF